MHAFTVLDTERLPDGTRLLQMRNPWGTERYFGPWSDGHALWTEEAKAFVADYEEKDNGIWFISAEDYHRSFDLTQANLDVQGWH